MEAKFEKIDEANGALSMRLLQEILHKTSVDTGRQILSVPYEIAYIASGLSVIHVPGHHSDANLSYIGGLFDGEGHIGVFKLKAGIRGAARYTVRCQVASTDAELLDVFKPFGGIYARSKAEKYNPNARPTWLWNIHSQQAASFLRAISPYLRTHRKIEAARIAMAIEMSRLPKGGMCRWSKEPELHDAREIAYRQILELNSGARKDLMDDKLTHRKGIEVEFADCVIRIMDTAAALGLDLSGAIIEKNAFNRERADHKLENRAKAGGKKF